MPVVIAAYYLLLVVWPQLLVTRGLVTSTTSEKDCGERAVHLLTVVQHIRDGEIQSRVSEARSNFSKGSPDLWLTFDGIVKDLPDQNSSAVRGCC